MLLLTGLVGTGAILLVFVARARGGWGQDASKEASGVVATAMARGAPNEAPIAVVNGEPIGSRALRAMLALQPMGEADQVPTAAPERIVDKFVERVLLRQEARRRGLECDEEQTRAFIASWKEHTTIQAQRATAEGYGVPVDQLETDPRFFAAARNFCSLGAVRRAIAAEHPEMSPNEAVDRVVADLRANAKIVVDTQAIQAIAAEMSESE